MAIEIRPAIPEDAALYNRFFRELLNQTRFMMLSADEYRRSDQEMQMVFRKFAEHDNHLFLLAMDEAGVTGFLSVAGGAAKKNWGNGYVAMGLLRRSQGQGIGAALFEHAEQWAAVAGLWRLELTVMADNQPAQCLYRKRGFEVDGVKRRSLRMDGCWIDELLMSKLIEVRSSS